MLLTARTYVGAAAPGVLRRPALVGGGGGGAMVGVDHARALRPQAGLRVEEGLHAAERGGGLPPHQLAPDQRLQLHQPAQRAQSLPRLRYHHVRQRLPWSVTITITRELAIVTGL